MFIQTLKTYWKDSPTRLGSTPCHIHFAKLVLLLYTLHFGVGSVEHFKKEDPRTSPVDNATSTPFNVTEQLSDRYWTPANPISKKSSARSMTTQTVTRVGPRTRSTSRHEPPPRLPSPPEASFATALGAGTQEPNLGEQEEILVSESTGSMGIQNLENLDVDDVLDGELSSLGGLMSTEVQRMCQEEQEYLQ